MKTNPGRVAWLATFAVSVTALSVGVSRAQDFAPYREYEPVVVTGSDLQNWVGSVDETRLSLHVLRNGQFVPIPFQVDKRRIIHTNYNVMVSDPAYQAANCELGYFAELHTGPNGEPKADFASNTLQATDEFVFLLKDALNGGSRASTSTWITDPSVGSDRYEIRILDPKTGVYRYVYAYLWPGQPPSEQVDPTDYVHWQADDPNAPCIGSAGACGTVSTMYSSSLTSVAALDTHFGGNWITDSLRIRNHGSDATPQPNILDRFRYSAQGEDETDWSTAGSPELLGVVGGTIRVVRGVEGAGNVPLSVES